MGERIDALEVRTLNMHAADENHIGPLIISRCCRADVLVHEADVPLARQVGGDDQETLRRHEGPHAPQKGIGMMKGAKGAMVLGKDAQHAPSMMWDMAPPL